ncbi:MAG: AraC family transcriptional regulator [Pseudomonadales bacterium]|nr:AraC family transcriptional regulator [Pseudomonadales bacterium]
MPTDIVTINSSMLKAFTEFLRWKGLNTNDLLDTIGLSLAAIENDDQQVDADFYPRLMQAAIDQTGENDLGFQFGKRANPERWGVVGYIMSSCQTLAEAIQCQQRYQQLVGSIGNIAIQLKGPYLELRWETDEAPMAALAEEAITGWITYGRWITGVDKKPHQVFFQHPEQEHTQAYRDYYGCPVEFSAGYNGIQFPFTFLNLPLRQANTGYKSWLLSLGDKKLYELDNQPEYLINLHRVVAESLPNGVPELAQAAEQLNTTSRSLQRKLKQQDLTYKQLVEQVRLELAKRLLKHTQQSMLEITFLLGFSEQSAFTRAFKRNTGKSPGEFRRLML